VFTNYIIAREDALPPFDPASLFEYVLAGSGSLCGRVGRSWKL
jgi:hypothetical protein